VYRAHLSVYGTTLGRDITRMTAREIAASFSPAAVGGHIGTRHGQPGIWIEAATAEQFRRAVEQVARFALDTGFAFVIGCTSAPGKVAADTASFSAAGIAARDRRLIRTGRA
jgi:hypothetical protein